MGPEREDADPQNEGTAQDRPRDVDPLPRVHSLDQVSVEPIQRLQVETRPHEAERDNRELRLGDDLVRASANAKVANFASNLAAFLTFFGGGAIVWRIALPMGVAQVLGSTVGTKLALRRGAGLVRAMTVIMALGVATRLVWIMSK